MTPPGPSTRQDRWPRARTVTVTISNITGRGTTIIGVNETLPAGFTYLSSNLQQTYRF